MRRNGFYRWVLLGCAAALCAATAAPGSAGSSTAKGWEPAVLISKTKAARETSLDINPRNPDQLFVCDPSGVPATSDGQSYFYRSSNGGRKWTYTNVESATTDTREYAFEGGDCDVAFDAGGQMWTADTWVGNLSIGHSTNGEDWEGTALAVTAPVVDRPWLVGGPKGTLYVSYHDLQCCAPSAMWFTKTTDNGKTFSPAVPITTANQDGGYTWEGNFVVAPGGKDIYLVYSRRIGGVLDAGMPEIISLASSHDGGTTWSSKTIATIPAETTSIYPSIGLDAGGYLHVAWAAPRSEDEPVFYTMSKDKGAHWTSPRALNARHSGYAPWVAGGKKGQARIVWLGSPEGKPAAGADWYFYYAKIDGSRTAVGSTTTKPIYTGKQTTPEFEMVRLDKYGRMHLGMSVFQGGENNGQWAVFYQREAMPR
jgi:hypothetical protein